MSVKILFGFHAVTVRLKTAPDSVVEVHVDVTRRDARMRQFVERAKAAGAKLIDSDDQRLIRLAGSPRHQGVVAKVNALATVHSLDDVLDAVAGAPLVLVLDGVTDPHNLGACLRVADGAGAHAVVAPKDHAVGLNATVALRPTAWSFGAITAWAPAPSATRRPAPRLCGSVTPSSTSTSGGPMTASSTSSTEVASSTASALAATP